MKKVTIGVPTYRRPKDLRHCLQSIVESGLRPSQVIVGDDSPSAETNNVIKGFEKVLPIEHIKNFGDSSMINNIYSIIDHAEGEWLSIIHDDDFFLPEVKKIRSLFPVSDFIFSDHWAASPEGKVLRRETSASSRRYGRNLITEGLQPDPINLFLKGSVCLDGFFVKTSIAKSIPRSVRNKFTGDWLMVARLIQSSRSVYFLKNRIFAYRLSSDSITSRRWDSSLFYEDLCQLNFENKEHVTLLNNLKLNNAPRAVSDYLRHGQYAKAKELLNSKSYPSLLDASMLWRRLIQSMLIFLPNKIRTTILNNHPQI